MALFGVKLQKYLDRNELDMVDSALEVGEKHLDQLKFVRVKVKKGKGLEKNEIIAVAVSVGTYGKLLERNAEEIGDSDKKAKAEFEKWAGYFAALSDKIIDLKNS